MASFSNRVIGAAALRVATYEEVEADTSATGQAVAVVVLSSLAAGLPFIRYDGIRGLLGGTTAALVAWFVLAALIVGIGTRILPEPQTKSDLGELLRTLGFAASPGLLMVVGVVPGVGGILGLVVWLWMLAATVLAVRQALDYKSTGRAVAVCVIGFVVSYMVRYLINLVLGLGGLALAF